LGTPEGVHDYPEMTEIEKTLVQSIVEVAWARKMLDELKEQLQFHNLSAADKVEVQNEIKRIEARIAGTSRQCDTYLHQVFGAKKKQDKGSPHGAP
jgi:GTP1/Obg family GTP-binding protein